MATKRDSDTPGSSAEAKGTLTNKSGLGVKADMGAAVKKYDADVGRGEHQAVVAGEKLGMR